MPVSRSHSHSKWLLVLWATLFAASAHATPIEPFDMGATHWLGDPFAAGVYSYDGTSDAFTARTQFSPAALTALGVPPPSGLIANDIFGLFDLSATIDETGALSGGSFSLVGSSTTLGIGSPAILLAGTFDYGNYVGGAGVMYQLMGNVDVVDPVFAAFVGDVERFLLNVNGLAACFGIQPVGAFSCSYSDYTSNLGSPDLFTAPGAVEVSVPGTLLLALVGLAFWVRARRLGSIAAVSHPRRTA